MPPALDILLSPIPWMVVCAGLAVTWLIREATWRTRLATKTQDAAITQQEAERARQLEQAATFQRDWLSSVLDNQPSAQRLHQLAKWLPQSQHLALWSIDRTDPAAEQIVVGVGNDQFLQQVASTPQLWQQFETSPHLQLDLTNPTQKHLLCWPSNATPQLAQHLLVLRCGDQARVDQVVCTTHIPAWTTDDQLNRQLLEWACREWKATTTGSPSVEQVVSDEEVRMVRIMLELRTIADMDFPSPMEMLREFLRTLARATGYERVSLFLTRHDDPLHIERFCGTAPDGAPAILEQWLQREQAIVQQHRHNSDLVLLENSELDTPDSDLSLSSGALSPLNPGTDPIGYLCLTSQSALQLQPQDQQIIVWAARFLLQTLSKTVDRVVVEEQARRDSLTRLANRHSFDVELHRQLQLAAANDQLCSLIMLDLDHFKRINDTYGHPAGDAVLKETARRIEDVIAQTRVADRPLVARLGGEELAVLLPGIGHAGSLRIAEAIRHAVRETPVQHAGEEISFTTSIGVAVCPRNGRTANELITAADAALYAAKNAGRDRVHTAAPIEIAKPLAPTREAR